MPSPVQDGSESTTEARPTPMAPIMLRTETVRLALVERVKAAKRSFVARRAGLDLVCGLEQRRAPKAGDLILATVNEVNHHGKLELPDGRRAQLYAGDEIVVAYGARYAPDQFEAVVPSEIAPCDLVAGGGIAAHMLAKHSQTRKPTAITPVGMLVDERGEPLNVNRFALAPPLRAGDPRNVIAVVGTSMNAGKTTLAANLIRGLSKSGVRVGACKVTGTGSGGDLWSMVDAGAAHALDFTDFGYATTSGLAPTEVEACAHQLVSYLETLDIDIVVVEIADGLLQRETAALLSPPSSFAPRIDGLVLAAADSMGALAGVQWLNQRNLPLCAVSGLLTASPLAMREAHFATGIEVTPTRAFAEPERAARLCLRARAKAVSSAPS